MQGYFRLLSSTKQFLISILKESFSNNPRYKDIIDHIHNQWIFTYSDFPQKGIVIAATGTDYTKLAADDYMGEKTTYCYLAKAIDRVTGSPYQGSFIRWVTEDTRHVTVLQEDVEVTPQMFIDGSLTPDDFDSQGHPKTFKINDTMSAWRDDDRYANDPRSVLVHKNGIPEFVERVNGQQGYVRLITGVDLSNPLFLDTVTITYWRKSIPANGAYYLKVDSFDDITNSFNITIDKLEGIKDESLVLTTLISPVSGVLNHLPIKNSVRVYHMFSQYNKIPLHSDEFTVDYSTGVVTITNDEFTDNFLVDYKFDAGSDGPFAVKINEAHNEHIPGVVIAYSNEILDGDTAVVLLGSPSVATSKVYGGKITVNATLNIFAKDQQTLQDITELAWQYLNIEWREKKAYFGIYMDKPVITSSDQTADYDASVPFYTSTIEVPCLCDWNYEVPLLYGIDSITLDNIRVLTPSQLQRFPGFSLVDVPDFQEPTRGVPPQRVI